MSDELLAAVLAAPDDDGPRLVYADWLEEHGDPARAEFIRVQIRIAANPPGALADRVREKILLHRHGEEWLAPFRAKGEPLQNRGTHGQFARGFLETVWMPASVFLKRAKSLFRRAPVRELKVTRMGANEFYSLTAFEPCRNLTTLDLSGRGMGILDDQAFEDGDTLSSLRKLSLVNCRLTDGEAEVIANCYYPWPLEVLDVRANSLSESGLARLKMRYGEAVIW